jgi:predicted MFS family arabinose efflux permease
MKNWIELVVGIVNIITVLLIGVALDHPKNITYQLIAGELALITTILFAIWVGFKKGIFAACCLILWFGTTSHIFYRWAAQAIIKIN